MKNIRPLWILVAVIVLSTSAWAFLNYFQGFEVSTGDWIVAKAITRVPSFGGALRLPSSAGAYHAEIQNLHDGYGYFPFGNAGYSWYGGADSVYHGDFYQAIDVYINAQWAPPVVYPTAPGFRIDMTPYGADPQNHGAEHTFRISATGHAAEVRVDNEYYPMAVITNSGWYTFLTTWRKAAKPADPVITDMNVYDAAHTLIASRSTSSTASFVSSDLCGNGWVWLTYWQNNFAGDVLAIDNQRTGLLPWRPVPTDKDQCKGSGWQTLSRPDGSTFRNQGDCIQYVNIGH